MVFKFYNDCWHFHPDFCRYIIHVNSYRWHREIAITCHLDENVRNAGSFTTELDKWQTIWINYFNYYKSFSLYFNSHDYNFYKFMSETDFKRYVSCINQLMSHLHYLNNIIIKSTSSGYDLNHEYYENCKSVVEYVFKWFNNLWIPLPGYEKPIKHATTKKIKPFIDYKLSESHWPISFKRIPHFLRYIPGKGPEYWFENVPVYLTRFEPVSFH